jgi:hypothetical protein
VQCPLCQDVMSCAKQWVSEAINERYLEAEVNALL